MEKLKAAVPESLKRMVANSNTDDLASTCSSLFDFLHSLPQFHQMVRDLVGPETSLCSKNEGAALASKQKGNHCYSTGDYHTALACYTQALRVAPMYSADKDKNLVATLYLNRASLFQKVGLLKECLRDCNRALQIFPDYAKAWYRRGKANAALGNYKGAYDDLNIAKNTELSLGGKRQIENELKVFVDQHNCTSSTQIDCTENSVGNIDELHQNKLSCVTTPDKGRGIVSQCDIPQATLVHKEEAYTLVILKSCRETHCHYCLNDLPADKVPCTACSIPLYCSQNCQVQAGGETYFSRQKKDGSDKNHLSNPVADNAEVMLCCDSDPNVKSVREHKHECLGVNWPSVLPEDIILAGRVVAKFISQLGGVMESSLPSFLDLSHNYSHITPESKLELHIYAIVLLRCLQHAFGSGLPAKGILLSQIVIIICQIRVNSMAIVRMKSVDVNGLEDQFGKFSSNTDVSTCSVEQVKVGQAIYTAGSIFNHSCQPNIHTYFLSRTLFIRTSEYVETGSPMELSYGPQVGQLDRKDRLKFLDDHYSFRCQCRGCSELNLSDLVLNAFHCASPNCPGIVLVSLTFNCEINRLKNFSEAFTKAGPHLQDNKVNNIDINDLAPFVLEQGNNSFSIRPGCCLNCGLQCDLKASREAADKAWIYIKRLQDLIFSKEISSVVLSDASRALGVLRSVMHAYNKSIAEAEDNLAQAFCLAGDLKSARNHCKASITILETLYGPDHIVIAHELVKLATILLCMDNRNAVDIINQLCLLFQRHYGSDACLIFPYLKALKGEACKVVQ